MSEGATRMFGVAAGLGLLRCVLGIGLLPHSSESAVNIVAGVGILTFVIAGVVAQSAKNKRDRWAGRQADLNSE